MMEILDLLQGSPEWHAHRATARNASDAPVMLGVSPYKTRPQWIEERATGIIPEPTEAQKIIFARGHAIESAARAAAEAIIGDTLSPCVGTDGTYSASFDGITFGGETIWECKTLNAVLRDALPQAGLNHDVLLPEIYRIQMEQGLMVSGATKALFTASDGNGDDRHCWYQPDPALRARIASGWAQADADISAWSPLAPEKAVTANHAQNLPAVVVRVDGALSVTDNLAAFGDALRQFASRIPEKPETDQEFADAEAACKTLKKAEDALSAAESSALAQVGDIEAMRRTVSDLMSLARTVRLKTEKLVKSEKDARRAALVMTAKRAFSDHVGTLQADLGGITLQAQQPDFGARIKGLSSLSSMEQRLAATLLESKSSAETLAAMVRKNVARLDAAKDYAALFPDRQDLAHREPDALAAIVDKRIADAKAQEERRIEEKRRQDEIRAKEVVAPAEAPPARGTASAETEMALTVNGINRLIAPVTITSSDFVSGLVHDEDGFRDAINRIIRHLKQCEFG